MGEKQLTIGGAYLLAIVIVMAIAWNPLGMAPVIKDMSAALAPILTGIFGIVMGYAIGTAVTK